MSSNGVQIATALLTLTLPIVLENALYVNHRISVTFWNLNALAIAPRIYIVIGILFTALSLNPLFKMMTHLSHIRNIVTLIHGDFKNP